MKPPFRRRVHGCIHPDTYKYFFDAASVERVWHRLEGALGAAEVVPGVRIRRIETAELLLTAPRAGNPVTVVRKRRCTVGDVDALHSLFEFEARHPA